MTLKLANCLYGVDLDRISRVELDTPEPDSRAAWRAEMLQELVTGNVENCQF